MKKLIIGIGVVAIVAGVALFTLKNDSPKEGQSLLKKSVTLIENSNNDNGGRLEKLLAYVPSNTTYLFGNKNAVPEDYIDKQLDKMTALIEIIKDIASEEKMDKDTSEGISFISNYYKHFIKLYKDNNLKEMGYEKGQRAVIYGYNLYPVLRAELVDSKAFINTINHIAKESNSSVEWKSCGKFQCLQTEDSKSGLAFVVKEKSMALSFFPKEAKDEMVKHLTDATPVKDAYSIEKFDKLLTKNNFKGFGDGFIDLEALTNRLVTTIKKDIPQSKRASFDSCSPIAQNIAKKVNKISFGTTQLSTESMRMLMIFDMDKNLTTSLQSITNKNLFTQRVANPLLDLGLNLNAQGLSTAITELANYIATQGEKYGCKDIDPQALRQGSAMASMSIGMSLGQISELYLSVNDLEMDKKGMPSKIGANAEISAPNPASLIGMLQMFSPQLAKVNIPNTGEEVDLLNALPKPTPPFITELKASMKDKVISLRLGEKPKMEQFKPKEHTILWAKINNKKYYELISKVLKENKNMEIPAGVPTEEKAEYDAMVKKLTKNNEKVEKLMQVLYDSDISSEQSIYVSDRGLVIDFSQKSQGK